jgi:hypothetical protein
MHIENRRYVVFNLTEVDTIDFSEVMETSAETLRRNVDNTQTFVKYAGQMPSTVIALTTKSTEYTHEGITNILDGDDWRIEID